MGQRLGIAAALLGDPQVLLFDEPVNGLDPEGILWVRNLMKQLAAEGRTVFVSSHLMSAITSIRKAITNTDRANQVIATADSALGQVSSLLNDIRGLVTEAANTGALSDDQIAANQLQLDSSLEALNRIAQTTTFQGRRLLDGSLDFITEAGTGFSTVTDLKIDQANLGSSGSIAVNVDVTTAAPTGRGSQHRRGQLGHRRPRDRHARVRRRLGRHD